MTLIALIEEEQRGCMIGAAHLMKSYEDVEIREDVIFVEKSLIN